MSKTVYLRCVICLFQNNKVSKPVMNISPRMNTQAAIFLLDF